MNLQSCNRKTVENLALAGAFDCFEGLYREQLLGQNSKGESVLETLMRYGTLFQQDKQLQQNSLFGDMGDMGVAVQHPEIPQSPRWSAIERLNIEKSLIGIFLSAHPLDEYEYEVREMCDITAAELTLFDGWRTPEARAAAAKNSENENANYEDNENNENNEGGDDTEDTPRITPEAFLAKYKNKPLHFGGIVTSAEVATSKKGNIYGRYIVEDYSGSYKMALFGDNYKRLSPMLQPNVYVYITGTIAQRGAGMRWFKEQADEQAEFELNISNVELLKDVQDLYGKGLTLRISLMNLDNELIEELNEQCKKNPGKGQLHIQIADPIHNYLIHMTSKSRYIRITTDFYRWLQTQEKIQIVKD